MACSVLSSAGSPTVVQGLMPHLRPNEPASQLASHFPHQGRPKGHREASQAFCNFPRVAHATLHCKRHTNSTIAALSQLIKNSNPPRIFANMYTCGKPPFMWETHTIHVICNIRRLSYFAKCSSPSTLQPNPTKPTPTTPKIIAPPQV